MDRNPAILQFLTLAVFSFGAPAFCVLALSYWRQAGKRSVLFHLFSIVCAAAFLGNLTASLLILEHPAFEFLQALLAALVPVMMLHLTVFPRYRIGIGLVYAAALAVAISDGGSSYLLAVTAGLALVHLLHSKGSSRQRNWVLSIFAGLLLCALASLGSEHPAIGIFPDYLVLAFFAARLYYTERLLFFDVFLRTGAYFSAGWVLMLLLPASPYMLLFVWLAAPLAYRWLSGWVNRRALNRPYSAIAAERLFADSIQSAATEEQLREAATRILESIFLCRVEVVFDGIPSAAETGELVTRLTPAGFVRLYGRRTEAPYLSDDRALLQSLAATLGSSLQAVREQELRTLASRAELRALRAQINPHFLFNALNTVAGSIRTHPEVADDTLIQLAEVFRYTLARSENEWVRLTDEIAFVRAYLAVEEARFGDRLRVTILGEPGANIRVPAMIIQPVVENAIKHGTAELTGPGKVVIEIVNTGQRMNIRIIDNGLGFPANFRLEDDRAGHGLRNVAQRLRGYYGEAGNLRWQNSAMGTVVTIEMPVEVSVSCVS